MNGAWVAYNKSNGKILLFETEDLANYYATRVRMLFREDVRVFRRDILRSEDL